VVQVLLVRLCREITDLLTYCESFVQKENSLLCSLPNPGDVNCYLFYYDILHVVSVLPTIRKSDKKKAIKAAKQLPVTK